MLLDDTYARTVRLLLKYEKGQWVMSDGTAVPPVKEGTCAELTLSPFDILDACSRDHLTRERQVPFIESGVSLWVRVDEKRVPEKLRTRITLKPCFPAGQIDCVQITLKGNLHLILRPNKDAKLAECRCVIHGLNMEAKSVNHAYTVVSRKFEPTRLSHGGNVFNCVYYDDGSDSEHGLHPLKDLRLRTELAFVSDAAQCLLESTIYEIWMWHIGSTIEEQLRRSSVQQGEKYLYPKSFDSNPALESAGKEYYEFRAALMVRNNEGLTKTYNRFHDPAERSPDILRLRALHAAMDRAVLDAYNWTDLQPTCEFLLDYEEDASLGSDGEEDEAAPGRGRGNGRGPGSRRRKKPWRYRWPDDFRDEVLARLLELNRSYAEQERLSGAANEGKAKRGGVSRIKGRNQTGDLFE